MTALVIANVSLRNPDKMPAYAEAAAKTLAAFGGEVIYRGKFDSVLLGDGQPHGLGVLRFPDVEAAKGWFASPDYQAIAPLRDEAADMKFVLYDVG